MTSESTHLLQNEPNNPSLIERKIVKKLDYVYVMPYIFVVIFLFHIGRSSLGYSSILGLIQDTHITLSQYGFIAGIGSIGHLVAEIPSAILLHKISVRKYLGIISILSGTVLTLEAFAKNFSQLASLRLLSGIVGTGVYPCCTLIISRMYRRKEQITRFSIYIYANGIATVIGGFITFCIGNIKNVGGLHSWQWVVIIYGLVTVIFGICCFFLMIDDPKSSALSLTPNQEKVVENRISNNGATESKKINYTHIKESLQESRYYCYVLAEFFIHFQGGAVRAFFQIIISSFGFSQLDTILISIPSGLYASIASFTAVWFTSRYGRRHHIISITFGLSAFGLLLLLIIPVDKAKIIGLYIATTSSAGQILILSSVTNNVKGSTKKIFYIISKNTAGMVGSFIGPQLMTKSQKPLFTGAMLIYILCDIIAIAFIQFAHYKMSKSNKERSHISFINRQGKEDPTDQDDFNFIYKL